MNSYYIERKESRMRFIYGFFLSRSLIASLRALMKQLPNYNKDLYFNLSYNGVLGLGFSKATPKNIHFFFPKE